MQQTVFLNLLNRKQQCLFISTLIAILFIVVGTLYYGHQMYSVQCSYETILEKNCSYLCRSTVNIHTFCRTTQLHFKDKCLVSSTEMTLYYIPTSHINGTLKIPSDCPYLYSSNDPINFGLGFIFFGCILMSGIILVAIDTRMNSGKRYCKVCCPRQRVKKMTEYIIFKNYLNRVSPEEDTTSEQMMVIQYDTNHRAITNSPDFDEQLTKEII